MKARWAAALLSSIVLASIFPANASIIGGDLNRALGVDSAAFQSSAFVAIGPVERFDRRAGVITVLGQTYAIDKSTVFASPRGGISVGSYVAVAGSIATAAAVTAKRIQALRGSYVDGSSLTLVRGQVRAVDQSIGQLSVGGLVIDYTPMLSTPDAAVPAVGEIAEFSGIKPSPNGWMLAQSGTSIIGGDVQGKSIIGGDVQGKSIIGGDVQGTSIIGGDVQGTSIIGGDVQGTSIIGGDVQGTSIIGGDVQGTSIIGGDVQGTSIIGGDVQGTSIIGGDVQGTSIIGGDVQGTSIIGGDVQGTSIIGGDVQGKSIIGGDVQGKSIIGGDVQGKSIIGGDVQGKSIIGGDAS